MTDGALRLLVAGQHHRLLWTYVGTTPISGAPNGRSLGTFGAESIYRTETLLDYAA